MYELRPLSASPRPRELRRSQADNSPRRARHSPVLPPRRSPVNPPVPARKIKAVSKWMHPRSSSPHSLTSQAASSQEAGP